MPTAKSRLTIREAAKLAGVSPQSIRHQIKLGYIPARRTRPMTVARKDVLEYRRWHIAAHRPQPKKLTDDEFIQRLWDSDPD